MTDQIQEAAVNDEHALYALLIEDDELQAAMVAAALAKAGFDATVAATGTVAIDRLTHRPYHLVLVDLKLPDINGPELIRVLRSTPHGVTAKILAVTASADFETSNDAIRAGADNFYHKSIGYDVLTSKFEALAAEFRQNARQDRRLAELERMQKLNAEALQRIEDSQREVSADVKTMREFLTAWNQVGAMIKGFRIVHGVLKKTWYVWAPVAAFVFWLKTGIWRWPS